MTYWIESRDGCATGYRLARRHYSAKKNPRPKIRQFVGPGEKLVLLGFMCNALFVWRRFIDDCPGQSGVNCAIFRNESPHLSSAMIEEAVGLAWKRWPGARLYTYIDPTEIKSTNPGCCFLKAGFVRSGQTTTKGLLILERL